MTQFHAHYVKGTLLSKATINASITQVARGDMRSSRQAIYTATVVNNTINIGRRFRKFFSQ